MVGGLVKQKHVGFPVNQFTEPDLGLLASAEHPDLAFDVFRGQAAFCQGGADLVLCIGGKFGPYFLKAGGCIAGCHFLLKVTDGQVVAQLHTAAQGRRKTQDALKQSCLADTVGAYQHDFLAPLHHQIERTGQRLVITDD